MIKKIDHIAIVVRSVEEALQAYQEALGLKPIDIKEMPEDAVKVAFLPVGESEIELVEPITDDSGVAKFLESEVRECITSAWKWMISRRRCRS